MKVKKLAQVFSCHCRHLGLFLQKAIFYVRRKKWLVNRSCRSEILQCYNATLYNNISDFKSNTWRRVRAEFNVII